MPCSDSDDTCVDPDHAPWPDCDFGDTGYYFPSNVRNAVCNTQLNTQGCGYDGGARVNTSSHWFEGFIRVATAVPP